MRLTKELNTVTHDLFMDQYYRRERINQVLVETEKNEYLYLINFDFIGNLITEKRKHYENLYVFER